MRRGSGFRAIRDRNQSLCWQFASIADASLLPMEGKGKGTTLANFFGKDWFSEGGALPEGLFYGVMRGSKALYKRFIMLMSQVQVPV